jgi:hypothetical protein
VGCLKHRWPASIRCLRCVDLSWMRARARFGERWSRTC